MLACQWAYILSARDVILVNVTAKVFGARWSQERYRVRGRSTVVDNLAAEDFISSHGSYQSWLKRCKSVKLDKFKKVWHKSKAYNASVINSDGKLMNILDFEQEGRPLVLNFGSCT